MRWVSLLAVTFALHAHAQEPGRLVFIAFFNAGVRVLDRGFVYIVDREGGGLHILALSAGARAIANLP